MSSVEPLNICQLISLIEEPTRRLTHSEIVWSVVGCLSGSESVCFGWRQSDQHFHVRHGLSGDKYLNQTLLYNYLNYFCKYGTAFKIMFDFCYDEVKDEDLVICYTFNAFRSSLRYLLIDLIQRLNTICDHLVNDNKEDKNISLIGFKYWLDSDQNQNLLLKIEILWKIFQQIRETALTKNTNSSLSFAILNAIYERIDFHKISIRTILFKLFINCLKPTLDYFDYILTNGVIRDSHQEFVFVESEEDFNSDNFWNNCLKIIDDLNEMPEFLVKHLKTILIASKSRLMSRKLNFETKSPINKSINLFDKFSQTINDLFRNSDSFSVKTTKNVIEISDKRESNPSGDSSQLILPKSLAMSPSEKTEYDSDLNYFDVYSVHNHFYYDIHINFELSEENKTCEPFIPNKSLKPIEMMINEALTQTIDQICSDICSELMALIIDEYKKYFNNFCDYYLLRSSNVLPIYCLELFQNINAMNSSKIDNLFALESEITFDSVPNIRPFISCDDLSSEPLKFFKNVHLIYSPIEWPFVVFFSDDVISLFNRVFQLLLKVKYSKWLLDHFMFTKEFRSGLSDKRMVFMMRFKLQNSVNKLYNYLMNEINVHINETLNRFDNLTNFEQLLQIHNKFIVNLKQTIFYRQQTLKNIVSKLINLCSELEQIWKRDNQLKDESIIKSMDVDIDRCNHLLNCFYDISNNN